MSTERVRWECPGCKKSYKILVGQNVTLCPTCSKGNVDAARSAAPPEVDSKIQQARPGNLRRSVSMKVFLTGGAILLIFILGYVWMVGFSGNSVPTGPNGRTTASSQSPALDKKLVTQWLRENLNDDKWEEVKWYPGTDLKARRERQISEVTQLLEVLHAADISDKTKMGVSRDYSSYSGYFSNTDPVEIFVPKFTKEVEEKFSELKNAPIERLCGMKLRTKNENGETVLLELAFETTGGKIRLIPTDSPRTIDAKCWTYLANPEYTWDSKVEETTILERIKARQNTASDAPEQQASPREKPPAKKPKKTSR